ncbi:MAG: hypothetical protein PHY73_08665, partial [Candidatus Omnitrophica bacterium]|nr:hypothetical protein [Candidatus Omnitrophota bacterium]
LWLMPDHSSYLTHLIDIHLRQAGFLGHAADFTAAYAHCSEAVRLDGFVVKNEGQSQMPLINFYSMILDVLNPDGARDQAAETFWQEVLPVFRNEDLVILFNSMFPLPTQEEDLRREMVLFFADNFKLQDCFSEEYAKAAQFFGQIADDETLVALREFAQNVFDVFIGNGQYQEAIDQVAILSSLGMLRKDKESLFARAKNLLRFWNEALKLEAAGKLEDAIKSLERIIKQNPEDKRARAKWLELKEKIKAVAARKEIVDEFKKLLSRAYNLATKTDPQKRAKAPEVFAQALECLKKLTEQEARSYLQRIDDIKKFLAKKDVIETDQAGATTGKTNKKSQAPPIPESEPVSATKDLPPSKPVVETKNIKVYLIKSLHADIFRNEKLFKRFTGDVQILVSKIQIGDHHVAVRHVTGQYSVNRFRTGKKRFAYTVFMDIEPGVQTWLIFHNDGRNDVYKTLVDKVNHVFENRDEILTDAILIYQTSSSALGFGDVRSVSSSNLLRLTDERELICTGHRERFEPLVRSVLEKILIGVNKSIMNEEKRRFPNFEDLEALYVLNARVAYYLSFFESKKEIVRGLITYVGNFYLQAHLIALNALMNIDKEKARKEFYRLHLKAQDQREKLTKKFDAVMDLPNQGFGSQKNKSFFLTPDQERLPEQIHVNEERQRKLLLALARLKDPRVVPEIMKKIRSEIPEDRLQAAELVIHFNDPLFIKIIEGEGMLPIGADIHQWTLDTIVNFQTNLFLLEAIGFLGDRVFVRDQLLAWKKVFVSVHNLRFSQPNQGLDEIVAKVSFSLGLREENAIVENIKWMWGNSYFMEKPVIFWALIDAIHQLGLAEYARDIYREYEYAGEEDLTDEQGYLGQVLLGLGYQKVANSFYQVLNQYITKNKDDETLAEAALILDKVGAVMQACGLAVSSSPSFFDSEFRPNMYFPNIKDCVIEVSWREKSHQIVLTLRLKNGKKQNHPGAIIVVVIAKSLLRLVEIGQNIVLKIPERENTSPIPYFDFFKSCVKDIEDFTEYFYNFLAQTNNFRVTFPYFTKRVYQGEDNIVWIKLDDIFPSKRKPKTFSDDEYKYFLAVAKMFTSRDHFSKDCFDKAIEKAKASSDIVSFYTGKEKAIEGFGVYASSILEQDKNKILDLAYLVGAKINFCQKESKKCFFIFSGAPASLKSTFIGAIKEIVESDHGLNVRVVDEARLLSEQVEDLKFSNSFEYFNNRFEEQVVIAECVTSVPYRQDLVHLFILLEADLHVRQKRIEHATKSYEYAQLRTSVEILDFKFYNPDIILNTDFFGFDLEFIKNGNLKAILKEGIEKGISSSIFPTLARDLVCYSHEGMKIPEIVKRRGVAAGWQKLFPGTDSAQATLSSPAKLEEGLSSSLLAVSSSAVQAVKRQRMMWLIRMIADQDKGLFTEVKNLFNDQFLQCRVFDAINDHHDIGITRLYMRIKEIGSTKQFNQIFDKMIVRILEENLQIKKLYQDASALFEGSYQYADQINKVDIFNIIWVLYQMGAEEERTLDRLILLFTIAIDHSRHNHEARIISEIGVIIKKFSRGMSLADVVDERQKTQKGLSTRSHNLQVASYLRYFCEIPYVARQVIDYQERSGKVSQMMRESAKLTMSKVRGILKDFYSLQPDKWNRIKKDFLCLPPMQKLSRSRSLFEKKAEQRLAALEYQAQGTLCSDQTVKPKKDFETEDLTISVKQVLLHPLVQNELLNKKKYPSFETRNVLLGKIRNFMEYAQALERNGQDMRAKLFYYKAKNLIELLGVDAGAVDSLKKKIDDKLIKLSSLRSYHKTSEVYPVMIEMTPSSFKRFFYPFQSSFDLFSSFPSEKWKHVIWNNIEKKIPGFIIGVKDENNHFLFLLYYYKKTYSFLDGRFYVESQAALKKDIFHIALSQVVDSCDDSQGLFDFVISEIAEQSLIDVLIDPEFQGALTFDYMNCGVEKVDDKKIRVFLKDLGFEQVLVFMPVGFFETRNSLSDFVILPKSKKALSSSVLEIKSAIFEDIRVDRKVPFKYEGVPAGTRI